MRLSSTNAQLHNELCGFLMNYFKSFKESDLTRRKRTVNSARWKIVFKTRQNILFAARGTKREKDKESIRKWIVSLETSCLKILSSQFHPLAGITNVINWFWDLITSTIFFLTQPVSDASEMQSNWLPCVCENFLDDVASRLKPNSRSAITFADSL